MNVINEEIILKITIELTLKFNELLKENFGNKIETSKVLNIVTSVFMSSMFRYMDFVAHSNPECAIRVEKFQHAIRQGALDCGVIDSIDTIDFNNGKIQ